MEWPEGAKDANELLLRDPDALHAALDAAANADRYEYERKNAASAVGELLDLSVKRASRSAVPTGFPALDDLLDGGLYAGLYIIGAIDRQHPPAQGNLAGHRHVAAHRGARQRGDERGADRSPCSSPS